MIQPEVVGQVLRIEENDKEYLANRGTDQEQIKKYVQRAIEVLTADKEFARINVNGELSREVKEGSAVRVLLSKFEIVKSNPVLVAQGSDIEIIK